MDGTPMNFDYELAQLQAQFGRTELNSQQSEVNINYSYEVDEVDFPRERKHTELMPQIAEVAAYYE